MKFSKGLVCTAALLLLGSCSDDSSTGNQIIAVGPQTGSCEESFGIESDFSYWKSDLSDYSFLKKEICERTTVFLQEYDSVAACTDVSYNEDKLRFDVTVRGSDGKFFSVYTQIADCSFRLKTDGAYVAVISDMGYWTFSSCLCKEGDYETLYRQSADLVTFADVVSSSSLESSSSSVNSSSSKWLISSSDYAKSSSSISESSSSVALSSSDVDGEVYSSAESSSSEKSYSSSYGYEWYSSSLQSGGITPVDGDLANKSCPEGVLNAVDMSAYTVAYEFNDPNDLGADYFGRNPALIEDTLNSVTNDSCAYLVLDGTNGLYVPLSDDFKNKGFVAEVKFFATEEGDLASIFLAEPPGAGYDAWQIRLDGLEVRFHYRDSDVNDREWTIISIGTIDLNEWHTVRVKIFPAKSGSGEIFYTLNLSLDGSLRKAVEFPYDLSGIAYNVGIGYDAQHQTAYNRKFFTGKIDYIRYGAVTEDGL